MEQVVLALSILVAVPLAAIPIGYFVSDTPHTTWYRRRPGLFRLFAACSLAVIAVSIVTDSSLEARFASSLVAISYWLCWGVYGFGRGSKSSDDSAA